ncbi:hypothetical protein [Burkholderia ubonensis]|uniref:InvB/SpaK family type III secretion system chaperone n=1 Tax=Burkholderia ubonensis TaxID=101571 RepID=UPI0008FE2228|nr:hypothetical protein [Burkholderia ubonensis]OJA86345.1 hypothetical protein BGV49_14485 [Burkholderia ubonensis]
MNIDIVMLIKESMEKMGCSEMVDRELDPHSPICIGFQSLPEMFVECEDEHVTLWSRLVYSGESQLARCAYDLLTYLMPHGSDIFVCRRPVLSLAEDTLLLHGRVEPTYLADAGRFTEVLEAFYEHLCAISEILER